MSDIIPVLGSKPLSGGFCGFSAGFALQIAVSRKALGQIFGGNRVRECPSYRLLLRYREGPLAWLAAAPGRMSALSHTVGHRGAGAGTATLAPDLLPDRPTAARGAKHHRPVAAPCQAASLGRTGAGATGKPL